MKKWIVFYMLLTLIVGCVNQGVKPEERDRTGKFDGVWFASIHIEDQHIRQGQFIFTCSENKSHLTMYIADGQFSSLQTKQGYGYIKEDGTFYVNEEHGVWLTSEDTGGGGMHYIFSGRLSDDSGEGKVVVAVGMTNYGCKGKVTFRKKSY